MTNSILTSTKKKLGVTEDYTFYDEDIIMDINSVFSILTELGVGPSGGFRINDAAATWEDYISDEKTLEMVKSYMALKVGLMFDPPLSSAVMEAKKAMISELEWRLNVAADKGGAIDPDEPVEDQEDLSEKDIDDLFKD